MSAIWTDRKSDLAVRLAVMNCRPSLPWLVWLPCEVVTADCSTPRALLATGSFCTSVQVAPALHVSTRVLRASAAFFPVINPRRTAAWVGWVVVVGMERLFFLDAVGRAQPPRSSRGAVR